MSATVTIGARPDGQALGGPTMRIRPVPSSEPPADNGAGPGPARPVVDRLLPPDLATGVRVRRGGRRLAGRAAGVPVGGGMPTPGAGRAAGEPGPTPGRPSRPTPPGGPAILPAPETILALVSASMHAPAPRPAPATEGTHLGIGPTDRLGAGGNEFVVAPGLAPAGGDHAPLPRSLELRRAARRLLGACVEIIGGFRPIGQLRPYCAPERFDAIVNRMLRPAGTGRGQGATRSSVVARTSTAPKPGRPARTPPQDRVSVRRVQICDVSDGVAELAVVMSRRGKVWAMAMRMERSRGR